MHVCSTYLFTTPHSRKGKHMDAHHNTGCSPGLFSTLISPFHSRYFSFLLLGLAGKLVGAWHGMGMVSGKGNGIDFLCIAWQRRLGTSPLNSFLCVCLAGLYSAAHTYMHTIESIQIARTERKCSWRDSAHDRPNLLCPWTRTRLA
jgi:hypothetical protein